MLLGAILLLLLKYNLHFFWTVFCFSQVPKLSCFRFLVTQAGWVFSPGVTRKSNRILIGCTHKLGTTTAPGYHANRTKLYTKEFAAGWEFMFLLSEYTENLPIPNMLMWRQNRKNIACRVGVQLRQFRISSCLPHLHWMCLITCGWEQCSQEIH